LIVAEGNYLLLNSGPWAFSEPYFDLTVMIEVEEETLRDRLSQRWRGNNLSTDEIQSKLEENDLPNGRRVMAKSRVPDFYMVT